MTLLCFISCTYLTNALFSDYEDKDNNLDSPCTLRNESQTMPSLLTQLTNGTTFTIKIPFFLVFSADIVVKRFQKLKVLCL